jgi:hypothetical protein
MAAGTQAGVALQRDSEAESGSATRVAIWPRVPAGCFFALLALYVAFGLCLSGAPMQDLPDHLTRAHIIGDLLFNRGAEFGDLFALKLHFSPYLAGDLTLASLDRLIGTAWAARVWIAALLALLPLSVWFALRRQGAGAIAASTAGILALYLASDHFFVFGFTNFLLGVACAFFAYGWFCTAARSGSATAYLCFVLLLLLSYAVHLTALVFIIAITAVSSAFWVWTGAVSWRRAAALMFPPLLLFLLQLALAPALDLLGQAMNTAAVDLGTPAGDWRAAALSKLVGFDFPAKRFNLLADLALFAFFLAVALFPLLLSGRRALRVSAEPLLIACALALLYLLTPLKFGGVWYASVRPLHYALVFLVIAGVRCAQLRPGVQRAQFACALLLALVNLAYVAFHMLPDNAAMERYKSITASIPRGAPVLPVDTRSSEYYRPFFHAGAYATLQAHAPTPYLFASDNVPNMGYFQYRDRPLYAPPESWYVWNSRVSWVRVERDYQYLLVTVPWDAQRIPVHYSVVARNDVAALLRLDDR